MACLVSPESRPLITVTNMVKELCTLSTLERLHSASQPVDLIGNYHNNFLPDVKSFFWNTYYPPHLRHYDYFLDPGR